MNDPQGPKVTWSDELIIDAMNEAMCFIAQYRPDLFEETITVDLKGTDIIEAPEGYNRIVRVVENLDPVTGLPTGDPIEEGDSDRSPNGSRFAAIDCPGSTEIDNISGIRVSKIEQAQPLGGGKRQWSVTPPVPADAVARVRVVAVAEPPKSEDINSGLSDIFCQVESAVKSFVLMRAFEVDTESAYASDHATRYMRQVMEFLGVTYAQQAVYNSGWYMGNEGDGDERARTR